MKLRLLFLYGLVFLPLLFFIASAMVSRTVFLNAFEMVLFYVWLSVTGVTILVLIPVFFVLPVADALDRVHRQSGGGKFSFLLFSLPAILLDAEKKRKRLSELDRTVAALRDENRKLGEDRLVLQGVFGSISQFIIVIDSDMNIRNANAAFL